MAKNGGQINFKVGLQKDQASFNSLKKSLQDLSKIKLADFKGSEKELLEVQQTAGKVQQALQQAFNTKLGTVNIDQFKKALNGLPINQIYQDFAKAGAQGQVAFSKLASSTLSANLQLRETHSLLQQMGTTMMNTVKWGIASSVMNTFSNSVQSAFTYVKSLEASLTDIRIVTGDSQQKMEDFAVSANRAAQALGRSTLDYSKAALTFYQQGLDEEAVSARTEAVLKAQNITGAGSEMANYLTSVWNGYKVANEEAELYVDKLAAVADSSASNMSELATAISKVASTANSMGVDIDQLTAQLSTVIATTRQAPESVGTAFKTIYARLNDIKTGSDEAEVSLGNYSGKMAELGFNVLDASGKLRDTGQIMEQIGGRWQDLTREQQVYLAQTMGGQRQINQVMSLFDNWATYTEMLNTSLAAQGTLVEKNARYMDSLGAKMEQLGAAGERVKDALIDTGDMKGLVDGLTNVVNLFGTLIQSIGGGRGALLNFGGLATQLFGNVISKEITSLIENSQNARFNIEQIQQAQRKMAEESDPFKRGIASQYVDDLKEMERTWSALTDEEKKNYAETIETVRGLREQEAVLKENTESAEKFYKTMTGKDLSKVFGGERFKQEIRNVKKQISQFTEQFDRFIDVNFDQLNTEGQKEYFTKLSKSVMSLMNSMGVADKAENQGIINLLQRARTQGNLTQEEINELEAALDNFLKKSQAAVKSAETYGKTAAEYHKVTESVKEGQQALDRLKDHARLAFDTKNLTKLIGSITQLAAAANNVVNIFRIWNDESLSAGEKISQTFTNLTFTLPTLISGLSSFKNSIGAITIAQGANEVVTLSQIAHTEGLAVAFEKAGAAAWASLGPYAALAAALAALGVVIYAVYKNWNKEADAAKAAQKAAQDSKQKYTELKTAYDGLKSSLEDYNEAHKAIEEMTAGTQEWRDAIREANDSVLELVNNYPELAKSVRNVNGQLIISEDGQKKALQAASQRASNASILSNLSSANARQANFQAEAARIGHNSISSQTTADGIITPITATAQQVIDVMNAVDGTFKGLTDEQRQVISEQTGVSRNLVDAILSNNDELVALRVQQENMQAANQLMYENAAAQGLQGNEVYEGLDSFEKQIANKLGAQIEQSQIDAAVQRLEKNTNLFSQSDNEVLQEALKAIQEIRGDESIRLAANEVTGWGADKRFHFTEGGEDKSYTQDQVAEMMATVAALKELGMAATDTTEMIKKAGENIQNESAESAVKQYLAGQDISQVSRTGLQELQGKSLEDIIGKESLQEYAKAMGKSVEDIENQWVLALEDVDKRFKTLLDSVPDSIDNAFNRIKNSEGIKEASYAVQKNIVDSLDQAYTQGGKGALDSLADFYSHVKDFDALNQVSADFDFTSGTAKKLREKLEEAGAATNLTNEALEEYIKLKKEQLQLSPEQQYKAVHDIIDKLKDDGTITAEQEGVLRNAGINVDFFFKRLADGTLQLKGKAEQFYNYANNISLQNFRNELDKVGTQIDAAQKFEDSDYSKAGGGTFEDFKQSAIQDNGDYSVTDLDLLKAQMDFLTSIGEGMDYVQSAQEKISNGNYDLEEEAKKISELVGLNSEAWENSKQKVDQLKQSQAKMTEELKNSSEVQKELDSDVNVEQWKNLTEYIKDYADQIPGISAQLKDNQQASEDLSEAILRYDSALGQVIEKYDKWDAMLSSGSVTEAAQAGAQLENVYSDLLDLPMDSLSSKFTQNIDNLYLLQQAANGSEEAYNQLREAALQDILGQVGLDDTEFNDKLANIRATIDQGIDKLQIGATIDNTAAIAAMNQLINAADMTATQATAMLANMGVDATVIENKAAGTETKQVTGFHAEPNPSYPEYDFVYMDGNTLQHYTGRMTAPGVTYVPDVQTVTDTKEITAHSLKVTSAKKSSGGGFKFQQASNGAGSKGRAARTPKSSGGGKGGGGKGSSKAPNVKQPVKEKFDRYHDVNKAIKRSSDTLQELQEKEKKLTGSQLLKNLTEQSKILEQQIHLHQQKLEIQKQQAAELQKDLAAEGVLFDENTGAISNYADALTNKLNYLNSIIAHYNTLSAEEQQKYKDVVEKAQKDYQEFKKQIESYDKLTTEDMPALQKQIRQLMDRKVELEISKFKLQIELELDTAKLERDFNKFKKNVIDKISKDDILGNTKASLDDLYTYFDPKFGRNIIGDLTDQINGTLDQINQIKQSGTSSIYGDNLAKAEEDLKHFVSQLYSNMEDVQQLIDEIKESIFDAIDAAEEAFEYQKKQYDFLEDQINHDIKLMQMLYGNDYEALGFYYDAQSKNNLDRLDFLNKEKQLWQDNIRQQQEYIASLNPDTQEYKDAEKVLKAYVEQFQNVQKELNDTISSAVQNLLDKYELAVESIFDKLEKGLTNGRGFDAVEEEWERLNTSADLYLDKINSMYEMDKLANSYKQAINDNMGNLKAQQSLNKLMEEQMKYLKDKDKLTQYDVDRANALLQIEIKRLALEQSRQSKSKLRLRRDSQGNYSYQYTADQEQMAEAEQELADAQNNLYNLTKQQYLKNSKQIYDLQKQYYEKAKEIQEQWGEDTEEAAKRRNELDQWYFDTLTGLTEDQLELENFLQEDAFNNFANLYNTDVENLRNMSEEEKKIFMESLVPQWNSAMTEMARASVDEFFTPVNAAWDALEQATTDYQNGLQAIQTAAGVSFPAVRDGVDSVIDVTGTLLQANDAVVDSYRREIEQVKNLITNVMNLTTQYKDSQIAAINAASAVVQYFSDAAQAKMAYEAAAAAAEEMHLARQTAALNELADAIDRINNSGGGSGGSGSGSGSTPSGSGAGTRGASTSVQKPNPAIDINKGNISYAQDLIDRTAKMGTGGYTGEWGNEGKIAILHERELVLDEDDTYNILNAVKATRTMANLLKVMNQPSLLSNIVTSRSDNSGLDQNVHIEANFPNVSSKTEIEEAFNDLVNKASQYAFKRNR